MTSVWRKKRQGKREVRLLNSFFFFFYVYYDIQLEVGVLYSICQRPKPAPCPNLEKLF